MAHGGKRFQCEDIAPVSDTSREPLVEVDNIRIVGTLEHFIRLVDKQPYHKVQVKHGRAHVQGIHLAESVVLVHPDGEFLKAFADGLHDGLDMGDNTRFMLFADLARVVNLRDAITR